MKIFIDGYGVVAHSIVRKLVENHGFPVNKIFVNTYSNVENMGFVNYLNDIGIKNTNENYESIYDDFVNFSPDYFFSLYGRRIIPDSILSKVGKRAINLHPSLLPSYKGCFSCPWVIINREKKTGITFHEIVKNIDAGDIFFQKEIELKGDETSFSLYHKLGAEFIRNFDSFFCDLLTSRIKPIKMPTGGNYYPRKVPFEGFIDTDWSDTRVDSFIKGMFFPPFKGAVLKIRDKEYEVESLRHYKKLLKR